MAANIPVYYEILGTDEAKELKSRRVWSRVDGVSTERRFVGPSQRIQDLFNQLSNDPDNNGADEIGESYNGQSGELVIRIADDSGAATGGGVTTALNTVWELRTNMITKPIESRREFDTLTAKEKRTIEKEARDAETLSVSGTPATTLYAYYANQVLDYVASDLMLTKSVVVSKRSTITGVYTGLNRKTTITAINPPSVLLGTLTTLPKGDGTGSAAWEWLYLGPQVRQVTKTKYQISYTWHGAERWAAIYGGTWNPVV